MQLLYFAGDTNFQLYTEESFSCFCSRSLVHILTS